MKKIISTLTMLTLLVAFFNPVQGQNAMATIEDWPDTAKKAAKAMIEKYGEPMERTPSLLIWENTGPFTHTIVYKEEVQHNFPMPHKDVLEQVINHDVPLDLYDELAQFDGSVIVERTKGTMAARCDKEAANLLALNLAHDIIEGEKDVEEAREYYADAMMRMMHGEKDEYVKKLTFDIADEDINNPDETVMDMSKVKKMKNENKH